MLRYQIYTPISSGPVELLSTRAISPQYPVHLSTSRKKPHYRTILHTSSSLLASVPRPPQASYHHRYSPNSSFRKQITSSLSFYIVRLSIPLFPTLHLSDTIVDHIGVSSNYKRNGVRVYSPVVSRGHLSMK